MTQVNLLPPEVRQRQRVKRMTLLIASAAIAALGLLFFTFVLQQARLSKVNHELAVQQETNSDLRGQISELQPFADLRAEVADKEALVTGVSSGRVLWSGVLRDVSMVIPDNMWLTNLTGSVNTSAVQPPSTALGGTGTAPTIGPALIGSIQFQGVSLSRPALGSWLTNLEGVTGWVNPWVSNSTLVDPDQTPVTYTFSGSLDLTVEASQTEGAR